MSRRWFTPWGWIHRPVAAPGWIILALCLAIGLTYGLSAQRRSERDGRRAAVVHFALRYLALIGLGSLISTGEFFFGLDSSGINWGVLQAIGMAGLVALPFIYRSVWLRAVLGLVLLAGYQIALENGLREVVLGMPHGGLPGAVSWSAMLLLATVLADLYHAGHLRRYLLTSAGALALSLGLAALGVVISKNRVSASYVLFSLGASGLLFGLVNYFGRLFLADAGSGAARWANVPAHREQGPDKMVSPVGEWGLTPTTLLLAWGRNPLLLYLLHMLGLGFFYLPPFPGWYPQAPGWLIPLQIGLLLAALSFAAWRLRSLRFIL